MIDQLKQAMHAMQVLTQAQDVVANNLANINTPGFKSEKVFYRSVSALINGREVQETEPYQKLDMAQGRLQSTGNPYDFAIEGKGFFQVERDGQMLLTRNGRFRVDSNGYLRDGENGFVQGTSGAIQIPSLSKSSNKNGNDKLEVANDGTIRLNDEVVGKLALAQVTDTSKLKRLSGTYFKPESQDIVKPDTSSQVNQGYYEEGNVNSLGEMVAMTKNFQLFQSQQRAISAINQTLSGTTTKLGKF